MFFQIDREARCVVTGSADAYGDIYCVCSVEDCNLNIYLIHSAEIEDSSLAMMRELITVANNWLPAGRFFIDSQSVKLAYNCDKMLPSHRQMQKAELAACFDYVFSCVYSTAREMISVVNKESSICEIMAHNKSKIENIEAMQPMGCNVVL